MKIHSILGRLSGTMGKEVTASSWRGINYIRAYAKPRQANTDLQVEHRARFAEATAAWKRLTPEGREAVNRDAKGRRMSGYNLFIRRYLQYHPADGGKSAEQSSKPDAGLRSQPDEQSPRKASPLHESKPVWKTRKRSPSKGSLGRRRTAH